MKKILLAVWLCGSFFAVFGQSFSPAEIRADLTYFQKKMEAWYPGLGYYLPQSVFEKRLDSIAQNATQLIDYQRFYQEMVGFEAVLKDGHFNVLHKKNRSVIHLRFLPFHLRKADGRYLVMYDMTPDSSLRRGTEIVAVEGRSVADLHALLAEKYRGGNDGDNRTGREYRTLVGFLGDYFDWFGDRDSVQISFRTSDTSQVLTRKMGCLVLNDIPKMLKKRYPEIPKPRENLSLEVVDSMKNTAILTINTFGKFRKHDPLNLKWRKKLKTSFSTAQQKHIENLVIDLRGNGGGAVVNSARLLKYLLAEPFDVFSYGFLKKKAQWPYMMGFPNPFSPIFFHFEHCRDRKNDGWRDRKRAKKHHKPHEKLRFQGHIYFLMNGASYSATVSVLSLAHNHGVGNFVGEAPGGAYWGDFAARFKKITLPNSKIQVRIPLKKLTHDVDLSRANGFSVQPDFPVERTRADILAGRDFMMPFVMQLIKDGKRVR